MKINNLPQEIKALILEHLGNDPLALAEGLAKVAQVSKGFSALAKRHSFWQKIAEKLDWKIETRPNAAEDSSYKVVTSALNVILYTINAMMKSNCTAHIYCDQSSAKLLAYSPLLNPTTCLSKYCTTKREWPCPESKAQQHILALLAAGAMPCNTQDQDRINTLSLALIERYSDDVIKALVKAGAKPLNNALSTASRMHHSDEVIKALLEAGAKPNNAQDESNTLTYAIVRKRYSEEIIKALLEAGAIPQTEDVTLTFALINKYSDEVIKALIRGGAMPERNSDRILSHAMGKNYSCELIKALIEAGAELCNDQNRHNTLSHALIRRSSFDVIRALFEAGAKPCNAQNEHNTLSYAIIKGSSFDVIRALIEAGAKPCNAQNKHNTLSYALIRGSSFDVISALFEAGAKLQRSV